MDPVEATWGLLTLAFFRVTLDKSPGWDLLKKGFTNSHNSASLGLSVLRTPV